MLFTVEILGICGRVHLGIGNQSSMKQVEENFNILKIYRIYVLS